MPALTYQCELIAISINYDGVTIYEKPSASQPDIKKQLVQALTSCKKLDFVAKEIEKSVEITKVVSTFERFVHNEDDDHRLYHNDGLDRNLTHHHIKFNALINHERLAEILSTFVENKIITAKECEAILMAYDNRFIQSRKRLDRIVSYDKESDFLLIKLLIKACEDNDLLADLHEYLLSPQFDHLREAPPEGSSWLGLNATGKVFKTTETWAMIEECITLQMANNIRNKAEHFSEKLAKQAASQLKQNLKFFAMSHRHGSSYDTSASFRAFANHDLEKFDKELKAHFARPAAATSESVETTESFVSSVASALSTQPPKKAATGFAKPKTTESSSMLFAKKGSVFDGIKKALEHHGVINRSSI